MKLALSTRGCLQGPVTRDALTPIHPVRRGIRRFVAPRCQAQQGRSPFASPAASSSAAPQPPTSHSGEDPSPASPSTWKDVVTFHKWQYKGHNINYVTAGCGEPVVLVHGFGASVGHYRRLLPELARRGYKVYALDLLGFGASDKPVQDYTMELWADQLSVFLKEFVERPAVVVGNSVGSLAVLMAAAAAPPGAGPRGVALLNSSGAMNNKGVVSDWRIVLAYPLLLLIDALLKTRPLASRLFGAFRSRDNVRNVLQQVYMDKSAVDDELVDIIVGPSDHPNALDVFVSVITGPPGPKPWDLVPRISAPMLVAWGDSDPFTPLDGPVGQYMRQLADSRADTTFALLPGVGHCPQDDRPELLLAEMLPWLEALPKAAAPAAAMAPAEAA